MFCGTDSIIQDIPTFSLNMGIFHRILLVPQNVVMDVNNAMMSQTELSKNEEKMHIPQMPCPLTCNDPKSLQGRMSGGYGFYDGGEHL
jgi:hypothetical protein